MDTSIAHLALYDTLADWEIGHLLVELRTGRFTGSPWNIVTVAESREPITTMGGLRIMPDMILDDLEPADSNLLILPGADMWDAGGGVAFAAAAARFLDAGVPVAAICGATAGLARAGLLDKRRHTSAAAEYLMATGYAGGDYYVDERAVMDGDLITAGPQSPVQFASRDAAAPQSGIRPHAGGVRGVSSIGPTRRPSRCSCRPSTRHDSCSGRGDATVPPRESWPEPPPQTEAGALLTDVILTTFRLNARLLEAAQELAANGGDNRRLVAGARRRRGSATHRGCGRATYGNDAGKACNGSPTCSSHTILRNTAPIRHTGAPNCSPAPRPGYWAIRQISFVAHPFANRIGAQVATDELRNTLTTMRHLVSLLEGDQPVPDE